MPPVCSQRAPSVPKMAPQSTSPGASCDAAELARSDAPTAPRTPKPRSVKFSPLRTDWPIPSYGTQRMWLVSTPPWRMRSSMSRPMGLSASAVATVVRSRKQRRRPRATLYSPPPSQARNVRAVWMRSSPGSSRSMISPSATRSQRPGDDGWMVSVTPGHLWPSAADPDGGGRLRGQRADSCPVAGREQLWPNHPAAADREHIRQCQVRCELRRTDTPGGDEPDPRERSPEALAGAPGHRMCRQERT